MAEIAVAKSLDLRGQVCPHTYVKTLLALEELASGDVLEVLLDFPQSAEDVPKSLSSEGHEVLGVSLVSQGLWKVVVRKA